MQKHLNIQISASYYTQGKLNNETEFVWIACHGYGQLAKYFMRRFDVFDAQKHFVIAPQGLSKFYLPDHKKVGATWMTKEDRLTEIQNQQAYLDSVFQHETKDVDWSKTKLILFGFSQGVATICRWVASRSIPFDHLILWAGSFPPEIEKKDIDSDSLKTGAKITTIIGTEDEYYSQIAIEKQVKKIEALYFSPKVITFEGKHEVSREVLTSLDL